jgi:hypothetical protein
MGGRIMKKKAGIILALAMVLGTLMAGSCYAAPVVPNWYICDVVASGTSGTSTLIMLSDVTPVVSFTKRWFTLNSTYANKLLATSLTGSASSLRVYALITNIAAGSTISNLYVVSDNFQ